MNSSEKYSGNWDEDLFTTNPNFKLEETPFEKAEALCGSCNFEIYTKDKKTYIICADGEFKINFYELPTYENKKTFKGHEDRVMNIRYFSNPYNFKEYLVSADRNGNVIVWDLETEEKVGKIEKTGYETFIYSCLLVFRGEKIFVVTSCVAGKPCKIFNIEDGNEVTTLDPNNENGVYYLIYWRKNEDEDYIIQCAKNRVSINRVPLDEEGNVNHSSSVTLDLGSDCPYNFGGLVYSKKNEEGEIRNYLVVTTTYGIINFFDITNPNSVKREPLKKMTFEHSQLYNVIRWSEDYLIVNNGFEEKLIIIDISSDIPEVISEIRFEDFKFERFIKKVKHPKLGECLFSINPFGNIKLWVNKDIVIS